MKNYQWGQRVNWTYGILYLEALISFASFKSAEFCRNSIAALTCKSIIGTSF